MAKTRGRHRAEQKKFDQAGQSERDDCVVTHAGRPIGVRHRSPRLIVDPGQINNSVVALDVLLAGNAHELISLEYN